MDCVCPNACINDSGTYYTSATNTCSHFNKMCVLCSSVSAVTVGKITNPANTTIRVKTNSMPNHFYSFNQAPNQSLVNNSQTYPIYRNLDFTVTWNPNVWGLSSVTQASVTTQALAEAKLCDIATVAKTSLPTTSVHLFATGYTDTAGLVGVNMVNMPIFSSLMATTSTAQSTSISGSTITVSAVASTTGYTDSLFTGSSSINSWAKFDNCLAFVDAAGGNIGIKTLSPCSFWG